MHDRPANPSSTPARRDSWPRRSRSHPLRSVVACAATLGAAVAAGCSGSSAEPSSLGSGAADLFTVTRGSMRISVSEAAELKAARETRIQSQLEGQSTIIYLIPEGEVVEQGDRVVELDVSEVQEKRANQGITVERARTALVAAQQALNILEKELSAELSSAKSALEIANIDREKFLGKRPTVFDELLITRPDGDTVPDKLVVAAPADEPPAADGDATGAAERSTEAEAEGPSETRTNRDMLDELHDLVANMPMYALLPSKVVAILGEDNLDLDMGELGQQVLEQIDEIRLAQQTLAISADKARFSKELYEEKYISQETYRSDELGFERDKSRVALAWQALDILVTYTLRKTKIELDLGHQNASIALEKVEASNEARRAEDRSEFASREKELELAEERLANFDHQLANAKILAPTDGLIVYAEGDGRGREMIQEGVEVRERQTILILPDVTRMQAEVKIQEADIDKVRRGQRASIQVDAFPDRVLSGRVSRVSPVADSGSRWSNNNLKVYKCWIDVNVDNSDGELRPNMSARVEILVGEVPDTLSVPISAVRRSGAVKYVWRATPNGPEAVVVGIGRSTLAEVEILDGINAGDQIYLAPPAGVLAPEFEQPVLADKLPELQPGTAGDAPPDSEPVGGDAAQPSDPNAAREAFQAAVIAKFPQFEELLKTEGFRAFRDEALRAAIEGDPELQEMQRAMMSSMRSRMGGRRGPSPGAGGRGAGGQGAGGQGAGSQGAGRQGAGPGAERRGG